MDRLARPIVLLTDYGLHDAYVGQMKAVLAAIAPSANVIDLSHDIAPYAVDEAAWVLEVSLEFLPASAVVLAVVDPGVGTARKPLVIRCGRRLFIGPDNGVLSGCIPEGERCMAHGEGTLLPPQGRDFEARELSEPQFRLSTMSATFHGRDIFAPAAAHLAMGADLSVAGPPVDHAVVLPPFEAAANGFGESIGRVVHVDRYGNLITTIRGSQLFPRFEVHLGARLIDRHVRTFADAPDQQPFCHIDSTGFLAIAVNQGSAAEALGARRGDPVVLRAR